MQSKGGRCFTMNKKIEHMTNLKRIREERGLTQKELAERSKVSLRMIQYYELGYKDINKAEALTVYTLSKALKCKVADLLEI